jgi:hypothetical protein
MRISLWHYLLLLLGQQEEALFRVSVCHHTADAAKHRRLFQMLNIIVDWDGSVDLATRYGLDGPGIESQQRRDITHLFRPALGRTQPPVQWVPGLSRGEERPRRGAGHQPHLAPRLKKEYS